MSDLVERVAVEAFNADENRAGAWQDRSDSVRNNYREIARAAIAEMFSALMEPSEDTWEVGCEELDFKKAGIEAAWQAMLTQARKEALGE